MKEIKVGKYSKAWYRKHREFYCRMAGIITFIGMAFLCSIGVLNESAVIYDWFTAIILAVGIPFVLAALVYNLSHIEFEGEYFDACYDRFIYNKIRKDRIMQDKKYHKWIV